LPPVAINKLFNVSTLNEKPKEAHGHGPANIALGILACGPRCSTEHGKLPKSASTDVFLTLAGALYRHFVQARVTRFSSTDLISIEQTTATKYALL